MKLRTFTPLLLSTLLLSGCPFDSDKDDDTTAGEEESNALAYYPDWPAIASKVTADPDIEARVSSILAQMTLEEKVGQMIQPNLDDVTPEEAKQYKLGSLLNGGGSWPNKDKHASAGDWAAAADSYWMALEEAYADRGFRIPFMWATDATWPQQCIWCDRIPA